METRFVPRINATFKVISKLIADSEASVHLANGDIFETRAFNISIGGIGVINKSFLPKGLVIALELEGAAFNLQSNIKVKGEITYCRSVDVHKYKCGLKFLDLNEQDRKTIAQFIAEHDKRKDNRLNLS